MLISVIMATHNGSRTIGAALDSVISQDIDDMELIVVDDCSDDDTDLILEKYRSKCQMTITRNEINKGVSYSRNKAIDFSKGSYLAFIDDDDIWENGKLKAQIKLLNESKADLCATARKLIDYDGNDINRTIPVPKEIDYNKLLNGNVINLSSVLIKKDKMLKFPDSKEVHEDYLTWLKILKRGDKCVFLQEPYLVYRRSRNSRSGNKLRAAKMTINVYREIGLGRLSAIYHFILYGINGIKKHYL